MDCGRQDCSDHAATVGGRWCSRALQPLLQWLLCSVAIEALEDREGASTALRYRGLKSNSSICPKSKEHTSKEGGKWGQQKYCHSLMASRVGRKLLGSMTQHQAVTVPGLTLLSGQFSVCQGDKKIPEITSFNPPPVVNSGLPYARFSAHTQYLWRSDLSGAESLCPPPRYPLFIVENLGYLTIILEFSKE